MLARVGLRLYVEEEPQETHRETAIRDFATRLGDPRTINLTTQLLLYSIPVTSTRKNRTYIATRRGASEASNNGQHISSRSDQANRL
jgi:hypothetical protein